MAATVVSLALAPMAARADQATTSTHVVEPGETLSAIADAFGLDSAALVTLNGLHDANVLVAGQALKVPARAASVAATMAAPAVSATPVSASAPPTRTVTVVEGDTLWGIAQRFGTTASALAQANGLDDADHLALGTEFALPAGTTASAGTTAGAATAESTANPATTGSAANAAADAAPAQAQASVPKRSLLVSYTVQSGETLTQVARQFGVRADAIARASGLDDANKLAVGAVLKVPVPGKEHVVSAGETLRDIALQEKVDLGSLIDFNQLDDPALIRVGQVVLVPVPATPIAAAAAAVPSVAAAAAPSPDKSVAPAAAATVPTTPAQRQNAAAAQMSGADPGPVPAGQRQNPAAQASAPAPAPAPAPVPAGQGQGAAVKATAPVAVVAPPPGAPSDGLAGAALKLLGSPYAWGGSSPSGFDCSGFVWYVARQAGKPISRGLLGEYNSGSHPARDELKPGDLVFFQNTYAAGLSHNGVYIGNGRFVSAADEGAGVTISSLGTPYWTSHWFGATRIP